MKINHIFTETKWTRRALALTFGLTMMICALFLLFGSQAAIKNAHAATIFTVNSTAATGDTSPDGTCDTCTLREAIQEANFVAGADRINFAIPGAGPHTIPGSPLPPITKPVTIDGYTQGGPKEHLDRTRPTRSSRSSLSEEAPRRCSLLRVPRTA